MRERFNRTIGDMIASYVTKQPEKWDTFLPYATFAYNTAVHASTGYTPFYLMYGREAREPNDILPPTRLLILSEENNILSQMWREAQRIAKENIVEAQAKQKYYYDRNTKLKGYQIGDLILLKEMHNAPGKCNMRWEGPYRVTEKKSVVNYRIQSLDEKKTLITHVDRMKKFGSNSPVEKDPLQTIDSKSTEINPQVESEIKEKIRPKNNERKRIPEQTRYFLRKEIKLSAKLKD